MQDKELSNSKPDKARKDGKPQRWENKDNQGGWNKGVTQAPNGKA